MKRKTWSRELSTIWVIWLLAIATVGIWKPQALEVAKVFVVVVFGVWVTAYGLDAAAVKLGLNFGKGKEDGSE